MSARRHLGVIVFGVIAAVIALAAIVFLFKGKAEYADINKKLKSSSRNLDNLLKRDPFPSVGNVEVTQANLDTSRKYLDTLLDQLSRGQAMPESMDPAEFQLTLERTFSDLMAIAKRQNVMISDEIAYGFERFSTGQLPSVDEVPRLVVQLKHISHLVSLLMESGITGIDAIERDKFDLRSRDGNVSSSEDFRSRRSRASRGRSARNVEDSAVRGKQEEGLYESERYALTFVSRERALWNVLKSLSRGQPFIAVSSVETAPTTVQLTGQSSSAARSRGVGLSPQDRQQVSLNATMSPQERARRIQAAQGRQSGVRNAARVKEAVAEEMPGQPGYIKVRIEVDVFNFDTPDIEGGAS